MVLKDKKTSFVLHFLKTHSVAAHSTRYTHVLTLFSEPLIADKEWLYCVRTDQRGLLCVFSRFKRGSLIQSHCSNVKLILKNLISEVSEPSIIRILPLVNTQASKQAIKQAIKQACNPAILITDPLPQYVTFRNSIRNISKGFISHEIFIYMSAYF